MDRTVIEHLMNMRLPVDAGRKLNVHKTFRRRPGRLPNVLCTFNLSFVSAGLLKIKVYIFVQQNAWTL